MGFLRNAYNNLFEPALPLHETYIPDEDELDEIAADFVGWTPPTNEGESVPVKALQSPSEGK